MSKANEILLQRANDLTFIKYCLRPNSILYCTFAPGILK